MQNDGSKDKKFSFGMTAEVIEMVQAGAIKLVPAQVGLRFQGTPNRYHIGYRPPRKLIRGTNTR